MKHEVEVTAEKKVSLCRCWKSKKFPYCDGAHKAHNQETGDNLGPVVVTVHADGTTTATTAN